MRLRLPSIDQDNIIIIFVLAAIVGLFMFTNRMLERLPATTEPEVIGKMTLQGRGNLPPLHTVMLNDLALAQAVNQLSNASEIDAFVNPGSIDEAIAGIIF